MAKKRIPVSEEDRAKLFLWCARHCCYCGKECTTNIVIHHIDGNPANNDLDNLIPVCFDCHGELDRYNRKHPVGTKYRYLEIKTRRNQVYELHTLKYLRRVKIRISRYNLKALDSGERRERSCGDISCSVQTLSEDIPIQLRLCLKPYHADKPLQVDLGDLYTGIALWNLNPDFVVYGHFNLPITPDLIPFHFRVEVFWKVVDILGKEHDMLPFSYVWTDPNDDWWFDPRTQFEKCL